MKTSHLNHLMVAAPESNSRPKLGPNHGSMGDLLTSGFLVRIVEILDTRSAPFVSLTQQFKHDDIDGALDP